MLLRMPSLMDIPVERDVPIPRRDGKILRADVSRPEVEGDYLHPDGTAMNRADGIILVRCRGEFARAELLQPGTPVEVTVDLAGTSNVFLAGHRIRLAVSSSNFPRFDRNTNTGGLIATDHALEVVFHDTWRPSHIMLPMLARP